ncbi:MULTISPECIES: hypothetical protein [unclassified Aeromicrobium]|uniref:hypothetical protein n=1 Tax=unclassified Aeromicrobium TaxID=2633570 RepID=UPI00288A03DA|nr:MULTISPECIES: hypothetical protein [unclassified Aeromicrobium]
MVTGAGRRGAGWEGTGRQGGDSSPTGGSGTMVAMGTLIGAAMVAATRTVRERRA